jgi:hypothetical protein
MPVLRIEASPHSPPRGKIIVDLDLLEGGLHRRGQTDRGFQTVSKKVRCRERLDITIYSARISRQLEQETEMLNFALGEGRRNELILVEPQK